MRRVGNTLYVQTQGSRLRLSSETLEVKAPDDGGKVRVPLQHLDSIVAFGNVSITPFLIHQCSEDGRPIVWMSRSGRFKARLAAATQGNVLLRMDQYRSVEDRDFTTKLASRFVAGKIQNSRALVNRARRDAAVTSVEPLGDAAHRLGRLVRKLAHVKDLDEVRGIEGSAASAYWDVFPLMVKQHGDSFKMQGRNRRPPKDRVNALLSFLYSILTSECSAACEASGLDPQLGYLHALRPGRPSLALDLMEEFRAPIVDRLVLRLINRREIQAHHFEIRPGGATVFTDEGRKRVLDAYQKRKHEEVHHPLLKESVPLGLLPLWQAKILARTVRGDLEAYRPWLVKT